MRIRESTTNLTNYGKVLFKSLPLQEGMHFSSRIQNVIEWELGLSMVGS